MQALHASCKVVPAVFLKPPEIREENSESMF